MRVRLAAALLAVIACSCTQRNSGLREGKTLRHENGLTATVPEGSLQATVTPAGFVFRSAAATRYPQQIVLEVRNTEPEGNWPESKQEGGSEIRYRIDEAGGGSGGEEHVLSAWKKSGSAWIFLKESAQAEYPSKPKWDAAWMILGSARIEGR